MASAREHGAAYVSGQERNPFTQLRREMDRLFDDFFRTPMLGGGSPAGERLDWPSLEVKESEHQDKDRGWSERFYGRFERSIALPPGADEEHCQADFRDGVLTVRIPKSETVDQGRKIPIGTLKTQH